MPKKYVGFVAVKGKVQYNLHPSQQRKLVKELMEAGAHYQNAAVSAGSMVRVMQRDPSRVEKFANAAFAQTVRGRRRWSKALTILKSANDPRLNSAGDKLDAMTKSVQKLQAGVMAGRGVPDPQVIEDIATGLSHLWQSLKKFGLVIAQYDTRSTGFRRS